MSGSQARFKALLGRQTSPTSSPTGTRTATDPRGCGTGESGTWRMIPTGGSPKSSPVQRRGRRDPEDEETTPMITTPLSDSDTLDDFPSFEPLGTGVKHDDGGGGNVNVNNGFWRSDSDGGQFACGGAGGRDGGGGSSFGGAGTGGGGGGGGGSSGNLNGFGACPYVPYCTGHGLEGAGTETTPTCHVKNLEEEEKEKEEEEPRSRHSSPDSTDIIVVPRYIFDEDQIADDNDFYPNNDDDDDDDDNFGGNDDNGVDGKGEKVHTTPIKSMYDVIPDSWRARSQEEKNAMTPAERLRDAAVKIQAVVKLTRAQRLKRRARWATKKLLVFLLSNVGLTIVVGLYAILGGLLFQILEQDNELKSKSELKSIRERYVFGLWNTTVSFNVLHPVNWTRHAMEAFRQFEQEVYRAVVEGGWDGTDDSTDLVTKWTFPGALLFSVTVITTIGYGDIVPKTRVGQAVCVVYAMIGIPLTLLCLANIGGFLANLYKLIWQASSRLWKLVVCMPKKNKESLPLDQTKVPVWVSLVTMGAYILLGAGIFSSWEKDWSFLDGSYFCFITLSTIGFGDFVPGQDHATLGTNERRVGCMLYLLIGLAFLAMVFQLIIDSVMDVLRRYASVLGLSSAKIERDIQYSQEESDEEKAENDDVMDDKPDQNAEKKLSELKDINESKPNDYWGVCDEKSQDPFENLNGKGDTKEDDIPNKGDNEKESGEERSPDNKGTHDLTVRVRGLKKADSFPGAVRAKTAANTGPDDVTSRPGIRRLQTVSEELPPRDTDTYISC